MITAKEARELAGNTVKELVEALDPYIRVFAEQKKRSIRVGAYDYTHNPEFWTTEGYMYTNKYQEAKQLLEDNGYKVNFHYSEHRYMYTLIEW